LQIDEIRSVSGRIRKMGTILETTTKADRREAINPIIKKSPIGGNGT